MTSRKTKKIIKGSMAAVSIIASTSVIASLIYTGYAAYADATKKPEVVSNYTNNAAKQFPASEFVEKMLSEPAPNTEGELTRVPIATANMLPESCIQPDMPDSIVYARSASNKDYSIVVQAYGAGQGHSNFDDYVKKLSASCSVNMQSENTGNMAKWDNGALMTSGDVVISVIVNKKDKTQSIIDWIYNRMTQLLSETNCVALNESSDDSSRSFYYDASKFKGLFQSEQVSTTKNIITNAIPQSYTDAGGSVSKMYVNPALRDAPDSPLPANMPASLPAIPQRPSFSSLPTVPSSDANINYQVTDEQGPGCGWAWAGQKTPKFNNTELNNKYKETKKNSIDALDSSVLAYNSASSSWALNSLWKTKFIIEWNNWIKQVNDIQNKWNDLDNKREAFKPTWINYVNNVYNWELDRLNRDYQQKQWEKQVTDCVVKKQDAWTKDSKNAGKTPTDDDKNQWKAECENEVGKPDILKTQQPAEPTAPTIPQDITVPDSWQDANEAKAEADEYFTKLHENDNADSNTDNQNANNNANNNNSNSTNNSNSNGNSSDNNGSVGNNGSNTGSIGGGNNGNNSNSNSNNGSSNGNSGSIGAGSN